MGRLFHFMYPYDPRRKSRLAEAAMPQDGVGPQPAAFPQLFQMPEPPPLDGSNEQAAGKAGMAGLLTMIAPRDAEKTGGGVAGKIAPATKGGLA